MVPYMWCLANEWRSFEFWYFVGHSILDQKPGVVAGNNCLLGAIWERSDGDSGGGVDNLIVDNEMKIVFALECGLMPWLD